MVKQHIPNENKNQRFKRLATNRTRAILDKLRVLGHCSNKNLYNYSEEEVKEIFNAIEDEIKRVKSMFKKPAIEKFKL